MTKRELSASVYILVTFIICYFAYGVYQTKQQISQACEDQCYPADVKDADMQYCKCFYKKAGM
jgi:hypothetical protein